VCIPGALCLLLPVFSQGSKKREGLIGSEVVTVPFSKVSGEFCEDTVIGPQCIWF